jgi:hypothetical protein
MSKNGSEFKSSQRDIHALACAYCPSMSGIDVKAHGGRNRFWKSDESRFEIYVLHWSCLSELKWK